MIHCLHARSKRRKELGCYSASIRPYLGDHVRGPLPLFHNPTRLSQAPTLGPITEPPLSQIHPVPPLLSCLARYYLASQPWMRKK